MPSSSTARSSWRVPLKLVAAICYAILLSASLFGFSTSQAQTPTSTITITPTPTGAPTTVGSKLNVTPAKLEFSFQLVLPPDGLPSKPKTVTVSVAKNQPAPVTLELPLMVSDPTSPTQFIVQPNNCSVIVPGTKCSLPIVFQPNGTSIRKAILLITSNAANGVLSVNLVGRGKLGIVKTSPASLSFGTATVGGAATASKPITLINKTPLRLSISGISSSNSSVFPIVTGCPPMLQPGARCTIGVSFKPNRNGAIGGLVIVTDNAKGPQTVHLAGSGKGGPTATRTSTATRTQTPTATASPGAFPMRAFPAMH